MKCLNPKFVTSAVNVKGLPILRDSRGDPLPEIAFIGRSNVGKSTLINDLFQTKGLAKTSSTPGKTQSLNFFTCQNESVFVDLPGYGYANVPLSEKKKWGELIESYLHERTSLKLLLFLLDIRRSPSDEDMRMLEWILFKGIPTILVFTKTDKVNASQKKIQTKQILDKLFLKTQGDDGIKPLPYVHYSAVRHEGRSHLIALMREVLSK